MDMDSFVVQVIHVLASQKPPSACFRTSLSISVVRGLEILTTISGGIYRDVAGPFR
jgi:hypothetical protein